MTTSARPAPVTTFEGNRKRQVWAIEDALRWTIRDELPKRRGDERYFETGGSIAPMWRHGVFGARIDNWSREPGMPAALGDPHPDALVIEAAIKGLAKASLDLSGYRVGYGLTLIGNVAEIEAAACSQVIAWLYTCAKAGHAPDLGSGPVCEGVVGSRGQVTLWLKTSREGGTGHDGKPWFLTADEPTTPARAGQYRPGTFCKLAWVRDANAVAEDRARYAAWHAALTYLATCDALTGTHAETRMVDGRPAVVDVPNLASIDVRIPRVPATPWIDPPPPVNVLRNLTPANDDDATLDTDGNVVAVRPITPLRRRPRAPAPVRRIDPADLGRACAA